MAYRADIEIAVKGAQELKRLQNEIRTAADAVDSLNSSLSGIANLIPRSFDNLNKTVAAAAKAFNAAASGTDEATVAARNYVTANRQLNQELETRLTLLKNIAEEERRQRLGAAGIRETTQYAGPIGPGPASPVASLVGQKSPVEEIIRRTIEARKDERDLQEALLRLEEKSATAANKELQARGEIARMSAAGMVAATVRAGQPSTPLALPAFQERGLQLLNDSVRLNESNRRIEQAVNGERERGVRFLEKQTAEERRQVELGILGQRTNRLPGIRPDSGFIPPFPPKAKGMFEGIPAKGLAGFLGKPGMTDALMGAGFPLLFGAGPGAILGGGAGGFLGGAMGAAGGPAGMALGIGLSAVGQILDQTIVKIADMGKAADQLNMDKLRESIVYVNADLETSVRLLIEAGKTEEARALAVEETAAQLAVTPDVLQDINKATQTLNMEWNATLGAITGAVAILAEPFITVISDSLRIVRLITTGFNIVATFVRDLVKGAYDWFLRLFGIKEIADRIRAILGFVYEDEQQRVAALTAANDQLLRELQTQKQILALEAQRTLGRTDAEKQINAEITKQQAQIKIREESAQREREIRRNTAGLTSTEVELALSLNKTKETQALKEQAIKDLLVAQGLEIEANAKKYSLAAEAVQRQIDALERGNQVRQSEFAVEVALNDLYGAQLQRQYEIAGTAAERYRIALLQFQQQVKSADIEYRLALANNQILVEKAVLQTKIVELKYKELEAEREIALAQAAARGNTPDQIAAIAGSYDKALGVQKEVLQSSYEQLQATKQITTNQNQVAKAVYQTKLIQAESALAQKLVSDEIGMSKRAADNLAYSLRVSAEQAYAVQQQTRAVVGVIEVGTQRTVIFAQAMSNVAAAANNAAYNIDRAFRAQLNLNAAQAAKPASAPPVNKAAQGAFWAGGFRAFAKGGMVTGPTLGLVGEGGESEYIIPESKMATASANYLAGGRGAGIMEGGGGTAPSINITTGPVVEFNGERYVTLRDLEKGMQQMAANIYSGLRTPAGRYATGVR